MILDAGEVPQLPGDRVAGASGSSVGGLEVEPVGDVDVELADTVEVVLDQLACIHAPDRRPPTVAGGVQLG